MIEAAPSHTRTHTRKLERYYRVHSPLYDATRWSFLFGRNQLLHLLPDLPPHPRILEVGCGTGKNIVQMEFLFPDAQIYGIDLSRNMLNRAAAKLDEGSWVELIYGAYGEMEYGFEPFDLILLSYSLSMTGDRQEKVLQQICDDLKPGGSVALVDFLDTPAPFFRKWMNANHVEIDGHVLPLLRKFFVPAHTEVKKAWLGLWTYLLFTGRRI